MLQYIAQYNEKYSIPEQAQMVIEGGCKWVQLRLDDMKDEDIRELGAELVPLCKETSTILTIENHLEMAKELGIHGVHLRNSRVSPREAREILGPEAIIGVELSLASEAMALKGLDIDYVAFDAPIERLSEYVEALRNAKFELPIVAAGMRDTAHAKEALLAGANGVAVSKAIIDRADPVAATEEMLCALAAK